MAVNLRLSLTQWAIFILAVLHAVGIFGILFWNANHFASLTPLILTISTLLMFMCHKGKTASLLLFFTISYIIGFGVELLGTKTGFPFGDYYYQQNLAPLFLDVPLVIGINWFLLAIGAYYLSKGIFSKPILRSIFSAFLMTALDWFIEPVAMHLKFWNWSFGFPPLSNYLAWFVVSIVLAHLANRFFNLEENGLAKYYFIMVSGFFIILNFTL